MGESRPMVIDSCKSSRGEFREDLVRVGQHWPPSANAIGAFIKRFEEAYEPQRFVEKFSSYSQRAAGHHRAALDTSIR